MTDNELEQLLGRQRLAAPHPSLRARVLDSLAREGRYVKLGFFDYAMAALAVSVVLAMMVVDAPAPPVAMEATRRQEISNLAEALGGGFDAIRYAESVVLREGEPVDPASLEGSW